MRPALATVLSVVIAAAASGQRSTQSRFAAAVEGVRVDALVTRGGRPVSGLTAADFEVADNGVPQQVRFVSGEDVPVHAILAIDISRSVAGDVLTSLLDGCRAAVRALRPIDRAAVLTFSNQITERVPLTGDRGRLLRGLDEIAAGGNTSLYDAVYAGLLGPAPEDDARTLLVVFSDGRDTASWLSPGDVVDAIGRSDAVVYVVAGLPPPPGRAEALKNNPYRMRRAARIPTTPVFLNQIASASGGRVLNADRGDLAKRFVDVLDEFQNRYLLVYAPAGVDTPGWHTLTVKVKRSGADVQARRGYWR